MRASSASNGAASSSTSSPLPNLITNKPATVENLKAVLNINVLRNLHFKDLLTGGALDSEGNNVSMNQSLTGTSNGSSAKKSRVSFGTGEQLREIHELVDIESGDDSHASSPTKSMPVESVANKKPLPILKDLLGDRQNETWLDYSIFDTVFQKQFTNERTRKEKKKEFVKSLFSIAEQSSPSLDRALGCMISMAAADSLGHHFEFVATTVDSTKIDPQHYYDGNDLHGSHNRFCLKAGQFTDDTAMALCLADSLLLNMYKTAKKTKATSNSKTNNSTNLTAPVSDFYSGSDCRIRYMAWWYHSYNNAFRYDEGSDRKGKNGFDLGRTSVGLGGNISNSLDEVKHNLREKSHVNDDFIVQNSEDAGNGSLMRLAPVPLRFVQRVLNAVEKQNDCDIQNAMTLAMDVSAKSSYSTHPGKLAAECCRFMTFLVLKAISSDNSNNKSSNAKDIYPMQQFLNSASTEYMEKYFKCNKSALNNMHVKVLESLICGDKENEATSKEFNWNWKTFEHNMSVVFARRGGSYNGYPVSREYFGSFCVDGLALALWACYWSKSLDETIVRIVNRLGDADTTGAIAGQIAGAFYGVSKLDKKYIDYLYKWDEGDTALRAAMLWAAE